MRKYFRAERILSFTLKIFFNSLENIRASASLSGGPAQNAKRKLRLKKKLENKYFLESLSPIYILIDLHPAGNLAILTLIFVFSIF